MLSAKNRGFTLIELLVVIAIIGILLAIGTTSFITAQKQARDSKRKADIEQIRQALETYRAENGSYPTGSSGSPTGLTPDYITTLPTDPKSRSYGYTRTAATTYEICGSLEIDPPGTVSCTASCGSGVTCNYKLVNP